MQQESTIKALSEWRLKQMTLNPLILMIMGIVLTILGIISQTVNSEYSYISTRYDDVCGMNKDCTKVTINIVKTMKAPIFISYELSPFFQNTDKYFTSISMDQLQGNKDASAHDCGTLFKTNQQMHKTKNVYSNDLNANDIAIPCGAVAFSYMNGILYLYLDTYQISNYNILSTGIAWESDVKQFNNIDLTKQWINMTDERFINWMRYSGVSTSRKLWGRIEQEIPPGVLTITVTNVFDHNYFDVKKYLIIHNNGQYTDPILVVTLPCLVMGPIFFIIGILFIIQQSKRKMLKHRYKLQ